MNIQKIKLVIITDNTTDEEIEKIHNLAMKEYLKYGKSSYLIVDEDE